MKTAFFDAQARGIKQTEWLVSRFVFSFSTYQNPTQAGFGLLRVFNDDWLQASKGFGLHPHTNMEIVSTILQGKMNHKDTMGYSEVVEKDWVQIMSAGTGLRHEEYNIGEEEVHFLQIWIEPKLQNIAPRYQKRHFPMHKRLNTLQTIVSQEEGTEHCWINQNAKIVWGHYDKPTEVPYSIAPYNKAIWLYCIHGSLQIAQHTLQAEYGLGIWDTAQINIQIPREAQFILIEVPINH